MPFDTASPLIGERAAVDSTKTMLAPVPFTPGCWLLACTVARATRRPPMNNISKPERQTSSVAVMGEAAVGLPALINAPSRRPNRANAAAVTISDVL